MSEPLTDVHAQGNTTRRAFLGVDNSRSILKLPSSHRLEHQKITYFYDSQQQPVQQEQQQIPQYDNNSNVLKKTIDQIDEKDFSQNSDDYNSYSDRIKSQKSKGTSPIFDLTTKKVESPSNAENNEVVPNQNNNINEDQPNRLKKGTTLVQKSKFNDLIFEVRMKNKARRLANSTHARMQKNLTLIQIGMIGDIAAPGYLKQAPEESYEQTSAIVRKSNGNVAIDNRRGLINQFLQKIEVILPLIDPRSKWKTVFEILGLFGVLLIFFFMSVAIAFKITIEQVIPPLAIQISLGLIFANSFVNLNTGFYQAGKLTTDRQLILRAYKDTHLIPDLLAFSSTVMLLIINSTDFLKSNDKTYSDSQSFLRILIFLPFCLKIRDFSQLTIVIEEKVIFRPQAKNLLQLATLFSTIILIEHIIACLWIFQAKLSFNIDQNWQTQKQVQMEAWFRQYSLSFYYSTVTMTTVGYGDITPTNQFEYIFSTILIIVSSGVFAFTLNQIGVIFTELGAEEKEKRRKINIINMYMERRNLAQALRTQIRQYLNYVWRESNEQFANDSSAMIEQLNDSLKRELKLHQNKRIIQYLKSHYSEKFIEKAIALIEEVQCKPQQVICTAGQSDDLSLFLVEKGKVEVYYKTKPIKQTSQYQFTLHEIGEGQLFGARNFYTGKPIDLNIRAIGFSNLLRIKRQDFLNLLQESPEDMEMYCYIRDRMELLSDHWKADSKCPSCNSFKHHLLTCEYLHYIPNHQNICLKKSFVPKITTIPERTKLEDTGQGYRRQYKLQARYDLVGFVEQFIFENIADIEAHEQNYLQYKFDYAYVDQNEPPERCDEDEEVFMNQQNQDPQMISHNQNVDSKSIKFATLNDETDQKAAHHQHMAQQGYQQTKKNSIFFPQDEDTTKDILCPARQDQFEEHQPFEKSASINHTMMSPGLIGDGLPMRGVRNTSKRQLSSSFSNLPQQVFVHHRLSSSSNIHQNGGPGTPKRLIQTRSFAFSDASEMSKNFDQKEGTLAFYPSNTNNGSLVPVGSRGGSETSQLSPLRRSKREISMESFRPGSMQQIPPQINTQHGNQSPPSMFKQNQLSQQYQGNSLIPQSTQNQVPPPNSAGLPYGSSDRKNYSRIISQTMQNMQINFLDKIQKMIEKGAQQQGQATEDKIVNEKSYGEDFLSMQQVFRSFDKQKNFDVYFPFHNLTYILMKLHQRAKRLLEEYIESLQNKPNKQFPPISAATIVRSKYEKSKSKKEKIKGLQSRSVNQLPSLAEINGRGRRRGEYFDKYQLGFNGFGASGAIGSAGFVESMTVSDRNIMSSRSNNNNNNKVFSFNYLFSRNDLSLNDTKYPEISPTVKQSRESDDDDVPEIHNLEIESKRSYFSNFSID